MIKQLAKFDRFFVDYFYRVHNTQVKPVNPDYIRFFMADSEQELCKELNLNPNIYEVSFIDTRDGTYLEKYLEGRERYEQDKKIYKLIKIAEHVNWE